MSKPKKVGWAGASQKARSTVRVLSRVRVSRRERFLIWSPVSTLVPTLRSDGGRVNTDGD